MGRRGYVFPNKWAEVPTDIGAIFVRGFDEFVSLTEGNKKQLKLELHRAFMKLLKEPEGTWWTLSLLHSYFFAFKEDSLVFSIDVNALIPYINHSLKAFKDDLRGNKNWIGYKFNDGLWEVIAQLAQEVNEKLIRENAPMLIELND